MEAKYRTELITGERALDEIRIAYEELFRRARKPNPFFSPEWVYTWCEKLGKGRTTVAAVVKSRTGEYLAIWPFSRYGQSLERGSGRLAATRPTASILSFYDPIQKSGPPFSRLFPILRDAIDSYGFHCHFSAGG